MKGVASSRRVGGGALKCFPKLFYYPDIVVLLSSPLRLHSPEFGSRQLATHRTAPVGSGVGRSVFQGVSLIVKA